MDLNQQKVEVLRRLDIRAEAEAIGVRFTASQPKASGWLDCHAVDREDTKPSAAINVSDGKLRGRYTDLGGGSESRAISFWDLCVKLRKFPDWEAALKHYADKTGVQLKGTKAKAAKRLADHISFVDIPDVQRQWFEQWASHKPGVTVEAIERASGRVGSWPRGAPDGSRHNVIAFAGVVPGTAELGAVILYRVDGNDFPAYPDGGLRERKTHLVSGSRDSLIVSGDLESASDVWVCEGIPDMLALAAHIPPGHIAITSSHGAQKFDDRLISAFKGKVVRIVGDCDDAGVTGAKLRADKISRVATVVKNVRLPFEHSASHGKDLRDFLNEGGTFEQLLALADEAPAVVAYIEQKTGETLGEQQSHITNVRVTFDEEGKEKKEPLKMAEILNLICNSTGDWPRRTGKRLFVDDAGEISMIDDQAGLFGFLQSKTGVVNWMALTGCCNKKEVFSELRRTATGYLAVERFPHHPPIERLYYAHDQFEDGDGAALNGLLDFFCPASDIDRLLIKAALATLFWGGKGGSRPIFVITAIHGRGRGKSKLVEMLASLVGGTMDFSYNADADKIKTRLLSGEGKDFRCAILDNVKSHRFSWAEFEALVTAETVSGHEMFKGEGRRPNILTWFVTLNGAAMSTDTAQRSVNIQLGEPARRGDWEDEIRAFSRRNASAIIADVLAFLKSEPGKLRSYSRWAAWEEAVLSRLPDPNEIQRVILERQGEMNVEAEDGRLIREYFEDKLTSLEYDLQADRIFIPSDVAALWYNDALSNNKRDHKPTSAASRALKQMCDEGQVRGLAYSNSRSRRGRGFIWTGEDADPNTLIAECLKVRLSASQNNQHSPQF